MALPEPEKYKFDVDNLAEDLGIQAASVRVALRKAKVEKAGRSYGWNTKADYAEVLAALKAETKAAKATKTETKATKTETKATKTSTAKPAAAKTKTSTAKPAAAKAPRAKKAKAAA